MPRTYDVTIGYAGAVLFNPIMTDRVGVTDAMVPTLTLGVAVASDSFDRANASTLGTADVGGAWTALLGTWAIANNRAKLTALAAGDALAVLSVGSQTGTVMVDVQTSPGNFNVGVAVRASSTANLYVECVYTTESILLVKKVGSTWTTLGTYSAAGLTQNTGYTITLRTTATNAYVHLDETQVLGYTFTAQDQTDLSGNWVGLRSWDASTSEDGGSTWNDFAATTATTFAPRAPALPLAPTASVTGATSALVTWSRPGNGGSPLTSYTVTSTGGQTFPGISTTATNYAATGLTTGLAQTFTVTAVNAIGSRTSPASNSVTPASTTVPSQPLSVSATAGPASATVSWQTPTSNGGSPIIDYRVRVVQSGATSVSATSPAVVSALTPGNTYTFTVAARNAVGYSAESAESNSVVPSTASSVTLQQIDGGPNYYTQWPNSFGANPSYFPLCVWFESVTQTADTTADVGAGLNTYVELTSDSSMNLIRSVGMWAVPSEYSLTSDPDAACIGAWLTSDEVDMRFGPTDGYVEMARIVALLPNDGRPAYTNYGKGVMCWESDAEASQFINQYQQIVSADLYWFTDPNLSGQTEGGWFFGVDRTLTEEETRRASNYGAVIDKMRRLVSPLRSKPIWAFIELGHPFSEDPPISPTITPVQVRAAVWNSIAHGAQGILYFNHSFGGPELTQHLLRDAQSTSSIYYPIRQEVIQINSQITALAPVLNAPTANGFTSTTARVKLLAKYYGGTYYIIASSEAEQTVVQNNVFITVPCSGTVTVLNESRTLTISGGGITDNFADGNTHHVYRVDNGGSCPIPS